MKAMNKIVLALAGAAALAAGVAAQNHDRSTAPARRSRTRSTRSGSPSTTSCTRTCEINYQSIGSGGGIRQITSRTVFFGATDGPMTNDQLLAAPGKILHFPTVLGGVVPVYNIPGVSAELKFTGQVLADIFLGKITKWNDPAIVEAQPGRERCRAPTSPSSTASDGSGTTYIWVDYLSKVSPEWKSKVGVATAVNWPVGLGGKGNEGVAGLVHADAGRDRLRRADLRACRTRSATARVQNMAGEFVKAIGRRR